jgi:hypothetical protein
MTDPSRLADALVALLPALPLLQADDAAAALPSAPGPADADVLRRLWQVLRAHPMAAAALSELADAAEDADAREICRLRLKRLLAANQDLAAVVEGLIGDAARPTEGTSPPGTVVLGDANTGGGDFVGRDQYKFVYAGQPPQELLTAYYRCVAQECGRLPLGVVDPRFVPAGGETELSLASVYTDLDVVAVPRARGEAAERWGLRLAQGEGTERTPLLTVVADARFSRLTVIGDPGSGGPPSSTTSLTAWPAHSRGTWRRRCRTPNGAPAPCYGRRCAPTSPDTWANRLPIGCSRTFRSAS